MAQPTKAAGPANRILVHTAARLHYLGGLSQVAVAREMRISTATVSRLLARARREGIVRIEVPDLDATDTVDATLAAALGLRHVRIADSGHAPALAAAVGALLRDADLPRRPVVAIGWGRAVEGVVANGLPAMPGAVVVPTTGGMNQTGAHFQINEFVRTAAERMQAEAQLLYAPARPGADLRAELIRDPQISAIVALWDRVDVAVMGIGAYADGPSETDLGFPADVAARVTGDIVRQYFDRDGAPAAWPGQDSQMGIGRAQLARIPLSIGICAGPEKVAPIIGAARSGMINALVTDARTSQAVLASVARGSSVEGPV